MVTVLLKKWTSGAWEDARLHHGNGRHYVFQDPAGLTVDLAIQILSFGVTQAANQHASAWEGLENGVAVPSLHHSSVVSPGWVALAFGAGVGQLQAV